MMEVLDSGCIGILSKREVDWRYHVWAICIFGGRSKRSLYDRVGDAVEVLLYNVSGTWITRLKTLKEEVRSLSEASSTNPHEYNDQQLALLYQKRATLLQISRGLQVKHAYI